MHNSRKYTQLSHQIRHEMEWKHNRILDGKWHAIESGVNKTQIKKSKKTAAAATTHGIERVCFVCVGMHSILHRL